MVHLRHRESRDLDFFSHEDIDLERLKKTLEKVGPFATTYEDEGTLRGLYGATKLEIFVAAPSISRLAPPQTVAGLKIGSLQDLMAMKIKVLAERGEARDYFDVKTIDEDGGIPWRRASSCTWTATTSIPAPASSTTSIAQWGISPTSRRTPPFR